MSNPAFQLQCAMGEWVHVEEPLYFSNSSAASARLCENAASSSSQEAWALEDAACARNHLLDNPGHVRDGGRPGAAAAAASGSGLVFLAAVFLPGQGRRKAALVVAASVVVAAGVVAKAVSALVGVTPLLSQYGRGGGWVKAEAMGCLGGPKGPWEKPGRAPDHVHRARPGEADRAGGEGGGPEAVGEKEGEVAEAPPELCQRLPPRVRV